MKYHLYSVCVTPALQPKTFGHFVTYSPSQRRSEYCWAEEPRIQIWVWRDVRWTFCRIWSQFSLPISEPKSASKVSQKVSKIVEFRRFLCYLKPSGSGRLLTTWTMKCPWKTSREHNVYLSKSLLMLWYRRPRSHMGASRLKVTSGWIVQPKNM